MKVCTLALNCSSNVVSITYENLLALVVLLLCWHCIINFFAFWMFRTQGCKLMGTNLCVLSCMLCRLFNLYHTVALQLWQCNNYTVYNDDVMTSSKICSVCKYNRPGTSG